MTNYKRYILGSAMAMFAMTNLHAQTYNDTVRTIRGRCSRRVA